MERVPEVTYGEGGYDPEADDLNIVGAYIHEMEDGIIVATEETDVTNDGEPIDPLTGEVFEG